MLKANQQKAIDGFIQTHGSKYDYSKINYVNNRTKVTIICPEHGEFEQTPSNHKNGAGCPHCAYLKRIKGRTSHGMTGTTTYKSYWDMKARCLYPSNSHYKSYGGRGITICDRWLESFENFLEDMGEKPKGLTLERKDVNKGYCPENCIWATQKRQQRNKRNNLYITINGQTKCLSEWCEIYNINVQTVHSRIKRGGWDEVRAITTPSRERSSN